MAQESHLQLPFAVKLVEMPIPPVLDIKAPELGTLQIRSTFETCRVKIGDRDLGYPPTKEASIAAGSYQYELLCPNGQNKTGTINVGANRPNKAIVP